VGPIGCGSFHSRNKSIDSAGDALGVRASASEKGHARLLINPPVTPVSPEMTLAPKELLSVRILEPAATLYIGARRYEPTRSRRKL